MGAVLDNLPIVTLLGCFLVTFLGGVVKGVVGFALPLVMISGLATLVPPEIALAGLLLPTILANLWQAMRQGLHAALGSIRKHLPFLAITLGLMAVVAQIVLAVPQWVFFLVLGVPITLYALTQLAGWVVRVPPERQGLATVLFGTAAGVFGGFAAVFGPPTTAYLISLDTEKTEQVRIQGMVFFLGNILLFGAHLRSGILNADTIPFSALMILPAALGMWLGFRIQDKLDHRQFLTATLWVLVIAGLNLVRRAFFA